MGQLTERPLAGALAHPAIGYYTRPAHDLVAELNHRIEDGTARITFDENTGYLRSVLDALRVPADSQMLVMSKTGVQGLYTGPANPRAIFFNDAVTVGYIRGAPLLELAVQDPRQGVLFYTIEQKPQARPLIERRPACLSCHQNYATLHVPGLLARSVFMAPDGLPLGQFGSYDADDRTPFRRRWGGWYVTGDGRRDAAHRQRRRHGQGEARGDRLRQHAAPDRARRGVRRARLPVGAERHRGADGVSAPGAHDEPDHAPRMGGADGDAPARETVTELVDYLLFVEEEPLPAAIKGSSGFAERFAGQGPADRRGRSLRQLDLNRRLMRYPCSYMVYSAAFAALPADAKQAVYVRMWDILSGRDTSPKYARLPEADRRAVVDILRETLHDLPADFM